MPDPDKNNYIDPVSIRITGLPASQAQKEGLEVRPMNLEESWETNKHLLEGQMSKADFVNFYRDTYADDIYKSRDNYLDEAANKRLEWVDDLEVITAKRQTFIAPEVLGYEDPTVELYKTSFTPGEIGEWYNRNGQREFSLTAEQTAESKGFYNGLDGQKKGLSDFFKTDLMGTPFKFDYETGEKTMLVLDEQRREWVEAPSDAVVTNRVQRSIWGPKEAESGAWENFAVNSYNAVIDETIGAAGTVSEVFGMLPMLWGDKSDNQWRKWGRETQNLAGGMKSKISEAVEQEGMFGSWRAFAGTAGNVLTQVGSQALVGLITRGASTPLMMLAKGAKAAKGLSMAMNAAPWSFGAAYAMQAMNDEAKAIGASDEARAILSLSAAGAVFAAERVLHGIGAKGLVDMFEDGTMNDQIHRAIRKELGEAAMKELKDGNLTPAAQEAVEQAVKKVYKDVLGIDLSQKVSRGKMLRMARNAGNWMRYSDKPGSFAARFKGFLSGGLEEGSEEWLESVWNGATKTIYNEGWANPNAEPGKGKFEDPFGELSLATFAAGFMGGSVMGALRGVGKKPDVKGLAIANLATSMSLKEGKAFLARMHRKGQFHNPTIDQNGQYINSLPKDKQAKAKSMNDLLYEQYVGQLEMAHEIMQSTGLADPEMLSTVLGNDSELQRDVLQKFIEARKLNDEKAELEAQLEKAIPGSSDQSNKMRELAKLNKLIAENNAFTQQVMDGTAREKYKALMHMRALEMHRNLLSKTDPKKLAAMTEEDREKLYQESLTKAQAEDSWNNREKAIKRVKRIQELNKTYKDRNERIKKLRKAGDDIIVNLDALDKEQDGMQRLDDKLNAFETGITAARSNPLTDENGNPIIDETTGSPSMELETDARLSQSKFQAHVGEMESTVDQIVANALDKGLKSKEFQAAIDELAQEKFLEKLGEETKKRIEDHHKFRKEGKGEAPVATTEEERAKIKEEARKEAEAEITQQATDVDTFYDIHDLDDYAVINMEYVLGEEAVAEMLEVFKRKRRIDKIKENDLEDDTDRHLVRMSAKTPDGDILNLSEFQDLSDGQFSPATDFIVTLPNGREYRTNAVQYLQAAKDGKKLEDGIYEYEGKIYRASDSEERGGQQVVEFQHGDQKRVAMATRTTKAGQEFVEMSKRDGQVLDLYNQFENLGKEADQNLVDETAKLMEDIAEDIETIEIMMEMQNRGILNDQAMAWLGLDVAVEQATDLLALYNSLLDANESIKNLWVQLNNSTDQREINFKKLNDQQVKWHAEIMNQLGTNLTDMKVMKNGIELEKPEFKDPKSMTAADLPQVVKAMQYWHLYFKQAGETNQKQVIQDMRVFWHREVAGFEVDFDGDGNPIFTTRNRDESNPGKVNRKPSDEGMQLNSFTDLLEWENFTRYDEGKAEMPFRRVVYYDFLNTVFNSDPVELYQGMLKVLDNPKLGKDVAKFPGAHTSEQMMIVLPLLAHVVENNRLKQLRKLRDKGGTAGQKAKDELLYHARFKGLLKGGSDSSIETGMFNAGVVESIQGADFDKQIAHWNRIALDHYRLVTGSGGSGKTTFITMTSLLFALQEGMTSKSKVLLVAPNAKQLKELKDAAKLAGLDDLPESSILTVDEFIDLKDKSELMDRFVIMDEVSLLTIEQRAKTFAVKYTDYQDKRKGSSELHESNTVIVMGDELQAVIDPFEDYFYAPPASQMQHGMNLTQVKRTKIRDVFNVQAGFRMNTNAYGSSYPVFGNTFEYHIAADGKQTGVRLIDDTDDFFNSLRERLDSGEDVALIVYNDEDKAEALEKLGDKGSTYKGKIYVMRDINSTPQGQSFQEVYVYMPRYGGMKEFDKNKRFERGIETYYNRYMGTAVGRAKRFVAVWTGDGIVKHQGSKAVSDERMIKRFAEDTDDKYFKKKQALYDQVKSAAEATTLVNESKQKANESAKATEVENVVKEDNEATGEGVTDEAVVETKEPPRTESTSRTETTPEGVVVDETEDADLKKAASFKKQEERVSSFFQNEDGKTINIRDKDSGKEYLDITVGGLKNINNDPLNSKWLVIFSQGGKNYTAMVSFDGPTMVVTNIEESGVTNDYERDNKEPERNIVTEDEVSYDAVDDSDGGTIEVDPTRKERNKGFVGDDMYYYADPVDPSRSIVYKIGAMYGYRRKNTQFRAKLKRIERDGDDIMLVFEGSKGGEFRYKVDTFHDMQKDYVDAVGATVKDTAGVKYDIIRLLQLGKLSVLNYYTEGSNYKESHKELKENIDKALQRGNVSIEFRGRRGGKLDSDLNPSDYYDKSGRGHAAEYIIDVLMDGRKVGIIPLSAIKKDVRGVQDDSVYYEMLRKWLDSKMGNTSEKSVPLLTTSGDPRAMLGDSARYVPGKDQYKSRDVMDIIKEIEEVGGEVVGFEQSGAKTYLVYKYYEGWDRTERIEVEAYFMREAKAQAESLIKSLQDKLRAAPQSERADVIQDIDKKLINFNLNQLTRDLYAGSSYAKLMDELGVIEDSTTFAPITLSDGTEVPIKKVSRKTKDGTFLTEDSKGLMGHYLAVMNIMLKGLTDANFKDGFNLRMPTTTREDGQLTVKNLSSALLKTVNNVQVIAPKLYIPVDSQKNDILGVGDPKLDQKMANEAEKKAYDLTSSQMTEEFKALLGDDFGGWAQENLVDAHGRVTKLGKILLNYNTEGKSSSRALYHELAHYVAEFLMSRDDRNALYAEIANRYKIPDWLTDPEARRAIAEKWAEMAERYASDRRNLTGISKFLRRMMDDLLNFFRKIGLYKSLADQYMYDIYVMKRYKGTDGNMIMPAFESLEDIYGEALNKAREYSNYQPVIDHYGDKDNATRAQHTVTQEMSKFITLPSFANRHFKEGDVSFEDNINRVEYNLRAQLMFETTEDGTVLLEDGMPKLRKGLNVDGQETVLQVLDKDKNPIDLFRYRQATTVDGQALLPILEYYDPKKEDYVKAPMSENGVYFLNKKDRNRIRALLRQAASRMYVETQTGELVNIYDGNPELQGQVKDTSDLRLIQIAGTLNDDVLLGLLQRNFQSVEVKRLFYGRNKQTTQFGEITDRLIQSQDTVARKETNEVSTLDRMSVMVRFMMNTVPQYAYVDGEWVPTRKFVRYELANQIMKNMPMLHYNPRLTSSIDNMKMAMLNRMDELRELRNAGDNFEDEEWVAVNSLYQVFFNDGIKSMSHLTVIDMFQSWKNGSKEMGSIYKEYLNLHARQKQLNIVAERERPLSQDEFFKLLPNRAKMAYNTLSAVSTHYSSIATDTNYKVTTFNSGADARSYVNKIENSSLKDNKERINRNVDAMMFSTDRNIGIHYRNLFGFNEEGRKLSGDNDYDAYTIVEADGIYYNDRREGLIKVVDINENGDWSVVNVADLRKKVEVGKVVRNMLLETYKENVWPNHGEYLATPRGNAKDVIGWEDFADIITPALLSAYIYSAENFYGADAAEKAPLLNRYKQVLSDHFGEDNNYGKTTQAQIDAGMVTEEDTEEARLNGKDNDGEKVYYPTAFFNEVKKLSRFLVAVRGGARSAFGYNVRDRRIYLDTVQDMGGYRFTDQGRAMVKAFRDQVEARKKDLNINQIAAYGEGFISNPMLGQPEFVKDISFVDGYRKGKMGKQLSELNERDNWDIALDIFMKDSNASLSNWLNKNQAVFMANHGDRSRQAMWTIDWKLGGLDGRLISKQSNGLLIKKKTEDGTTFDVDAENIMAHVLNNYRIAIKAQARSLNKWVDFFMGKSTMDTNIMTAEDLISDEDLISTESGKGYDKVIATMKKVNQFLKEADLFTYMDANGKLSIPHPDLPVHLFGTNIKMGEDFVVIKKTDKNGVQRARVALGFAGRLFGDIKESDVDGNRLTVYSPISWLSSSNRMFHMDYTMKDGTKVPTLAHLALRMNADGEALNLEDSKKTLYGIFKDDLNEANRLAKEHGFKLYAEQIQTTQKLPSGKDYVEGFKVAGGAYYNPMAAMVMAHSLQNAYHMFAFEGTFANHLSYEFDMAKHNNTKAVYTTNANKRFLQHSSTMQIPNYGGYYMIDVNTKTLHIAEALMPAQITTASADGSIETNEHSPFDGQGFVNPLHALMLWHSYGGPNGNMDQFGNLKTVSVQSETGNYYKHSLDRPTMQSMELMPEQRLMVEIMLNPTARPLTDEAIEFEDELNAGGRFADNDSLLQRFKLYEAESYYWRANEQMEKVIEEHGGIRNFLKQNPPVIEGVVVPYSDAVIDSMVKDYNTRMQATEMFKYDALKLLMENAGMSDKVIPVDPTKTTKADGDWALNKLLDFYAGIRAQVGSERAQEMYPYISHIEIDGGAIKQKGRVIPIPVNFNYAGSSTLVPLSRMAVDTVDEQGNPVRNVPVDLFSAYAAHMEAGKPMNLGAFLQDRNNLEEGLQLNANRDYDDSLEAPMVQMMSLLISSPHLHGESDLGQRMMDLMAEIMEEAMIGFEMEYDSFKSDLESKEQDEKGFISTEENQILQRFLKEKVKINIAKQDDSSMMGVIVNNDQIHISTSMGTEERLYQYLGSYFRKNVVKRKVEAMRLVQASGMLVELYDYQHPSGRVLSMSLAEAKRYAVRNLGMKSTDDLPPSFTKRGLKPTVIKRIEGAEVSEAEQQLLSGMTDSEKLRWYIENGKAEIIPGEVVIPAAKFAKYNIPKTTSINELYSLNFYDGKNPDQVLLHDLVDPTRRDELKDVIREFVEKALRFETREVNGKQRTTVVYTDYVRYGENPYMDLLFHDGFKTWLKRNQDKVRQIQKDAKARQIEEAGGQEGFLKKFIDANAVKQMMEERSQIIHDMIMESIVNDTEASFPDMLNMMVDGMIATKLAAHEVLGTRTPSGPGSTFYNTAVYLVNDNGSTGYVNTIKNEIDGSDMDIDQFTMYYLSDTMKELGYSQQEINERMAKFKEDKNFQAITEEKTNIINNQLMKLILEYYKDPKATDMTMSAIGLGSIREATKGQYEKMFPMGDYAFNLGHTISMRVLSMDGKAVGPSANAQKGQNYLMAAFQALGNEGLNASVMPMLYNSETGELLSTEKYRDIPRRIEGLTNASTDNPKLMYLGAINVNIENMSTVANAHFANKLLVDFVNRHPTRFGYAEGTVVGEEEAVYAFFKGDAHKNIFKNMKRKSSVKEDDYSKGLYAEAHAYYDRLKENNDKYKSKTKKASEDMLVALGQVRSILAELTSEEEVDAILTDEMGITSDIKPALIKMASKAVKKKYLPITKLLQAYLRGDLKAYADVELTNAVEEQLAAARKGYYTDVAEIMDEANKVMGIKPGEETDKLLTKGKEWQEKMGTFFKALRDYDRAKRQFDYNNKLSSEVYQEEVLLVAKYAFFGDWMDRWVKIVGINQFGISSAYDAFSYAENLKFMTGFEIKELVRIYKEYKKGKEAGVYNSPRDFMTKHKDYDLSPDEVQARAMEMYKHRFAREGGKAYRHMTKAIGDDNLGIDYMTDFFQLGDVTELLFSLPPIMESIIAAYEVDSKATQVLATRQQQYQDLLNDILEDTARDTINERRYRTFFEEVHKYISGKYLSQPKVERAMNAALEGLADLGMDIESKVGKPLIGLNDTGRVPGITKAVDADTFIMQFPGFWEATILPALTHSETITNESARKLLRALHVKRKGTYAYLEIANTASYTPHEMTVLREGYKALPKPVRDLLAIYQLAKDGFSYKSNAFLSQVISEDWYEDFSRYIEDTMLERNRMSESDKEYLKMMVLSNLKNDLAPKAKSIKVGKDWIQLPPIGAFGPATYYNKQIHLEFTKYGRKEQRALVKGEQSKMVMPSRANVVNRTDRIIPAKDILDVDAQVLTKGSYKGVSLKGLKLAAYFNWIIKGNIERIVQEEYEKQGGPEGKFSMDEVRRQVMTIEFMNKPENYMKEYRREAFEYKMKGDKLDRIQITKELADKYQKDLAQHFKEIYKEDPDAFNAIVEDASGMVIADAKTYSEIGLSYQLAMLFNQLMHEQTKSPKQSFYELLDGVVGMAEDLPPIIDETYYINMHAGRVGNYYRDVAMTSDHVLEFDPYARDKMEIRLGQLENQMTLMDKSTMLRVVEKVWTGQKDAVDLLDKAKLPDFIKAFDDVVPRANYLSDNDYMHALVDYIGRNATRKQVEYNIDLNKANEHAIENKMRTGREFDMKRRSTHFFEEGDVVYFKDGSVGLVTGLSDYDNSDDPKPRAYSYRLVEKPRSFEIADLFMSKVSLEDYMQGNNARYTVESLVRSIAKAMPGVPYRFIGNREQQAMGIKGAVSFYKDGVVYINLDKADRATAIHEFAHPYVIALKNERKDLYDALAASVMKDQELIDYIRRSYPELLTIDEILMEAIPTYIQMRFYAHDYYRQTEGERAAWSDYFDWVKTTFTNAVTEGVNNTTSLNDLDWSNATLNDFADAIIKDLTSEASIPWLSNKHYAHAVPYVMKAKSTSKVKNISLSNLDRLIQRKASYSSQVEKERAVRSRIQRSLMSGQNFVGLSGTYNFNEGNPRFKTNGKLDIGKRERYIQQAVTAESKLMDSVAEQTINFLKATQSGEMGIVQAAKQTLLRGLKDDYKEDEKLYGKYEQMLTTMLIELNFNPATDSAMSLDDAVKVLGIKLPTNITVEDKPIVIIHNRGKSNEAVSLLNVTTLSLTETGAMDMRPINQAFAEEANINRADRRRFEQNSLMNTRQDINALRNGVIAMAMKKAKPELQIRRVGTVQMTGYEGQPYRKHYKEMEDIVPQIEKFFSAPVLLESIERDLYEIVTDKELLNTKNYKLDYLEKLGRYLESALAQEKSREKGKPERLQEALDTLRHVQEDHLQAKMPALARAIKARLDYLRIEVLDNNTELVAKSTEYQDLAYTYLQLTSYNEINTKKVTPITADEKWVDTADRWHGQVRTWVFDSLDLGLRKSKEELIPFQETIDAKVNTLYKLHPELKGATDTSHQLFRRLFKTRKVKTKDGREVEVSLHELHWDKNDPDTKQLLDDGVLLEEEVDFAAWLADQLYEEFVRYVMDVERSSIQQSHNDTEEYLRVQAEQKVNARYKKGMLPVFIQTGASALSEGNIKKAFEIFTKTAGRWYGGNIFEEYKQGDSDALQEGAFRKLLSPFWQQFRSAETFGSYDRLQLLGLGITANDPNSGEEGGELVLLNESRQETLSFNLENIGLFTQAASMRARHLKDGVNKVNIALDILRGEQALKGTDVGDIIAQMENYVNRQVYGNLPEVGKMQIAGVTINIDNMLDASGRLIHIIHLAANAVLGSKNMSSQAIKLFTNSLVNAMSGNKQFKPQHVMRAVQEVITNPQKVSELNKMYQIVNITERDLINHFKNNMTRKNMFETEFQMIFHWFGDHYTQLIAAMAQMMEDGTYDAHEIVDGKIVYDETKDKRFQGEGGDVIKTAIMRQQMKEEYHMPKDGKMTHAYSQRMENGIKVIVQRYVSELNDTQYKNMISSYGLARAVMSLKTYMFNVKQHWWKNRRAEVQTGRFIINPEDAKEAVWEPDMVEGVLQTWMYLGKVLKDNLTGVGGKIEWDEHRTRNMIHTAVTVTVIAGVYFLVDLMSEGFDDDEDKRKRNPEPVFYGKMLWDRFTKTGYVPTKDQGEINYFQLMLRYIIGGAANEQLSYANPAQIVKEWRKSPNPYIWQAQNTWDALTMLMGFPADLYNQDAGVAEDVDKLTYSMSKTLPYGNVYRTLRNAYVKISEDVIDDSLNANYKPQ